ncbi:hypothetical protein IM511_09325 [Erythrobacteraceae bacterium E2-1 Yellow Sea]|nr:hypothetical protein [Erythrobacteraceae bacterium E2-1 Yellow Sea]
MRHIAHANCIDVKGDGGQRYKQRQTIAHRDIKAVAQQFHNGKSVSESIVTPAPCQNNVFALLVIH